MHKYAIINKQDILSENLAESLKSHLNEFMSYDEKNPDLFADMRGGRLCIDSQCDSHLRLSGF